MSNQTQLAEALKALVTPATVNTAEVLQGAVMAQQQLNLNIWELTERLRKATDMTESNQKDIEAYMLRLRNTKLRAEAVNRQLSASKNRLGRVHEILLSRTAALRKSNELLKDELVREPVLGGHLHMSDPTAEEPSELATSPESKLTEGKPVDQVVDSPGSEAAVEDITTDRQAEEVVAGKEATGTEDKTEEHTAVEDAVVEEEAAVEEKAEDTVEQTTVADDPIEGMPNAESADVVADTTEEVVEDEAVEEKATEAAEGGKKKGKRGKKGR